MNYLPFSSSHSEGGGGGGSILQGASGGEQGEGDGTSLMGDLKESTTLTKKQRLYGFAICFCIGVGMSILSSFFFFQPTKFAVLYSLGNILGLLSTGFLIGPWKQMKNMFKKKRIIASIVFLVMIIVTVLVAIVIPFPNKGSRIIILLICIAIQSCALIWYTASYIPYARNMIKRCATKCVGV